jgi:predicted aminopeptidase
MRPMPAPKPAALQAQGWEVCLWRARVFHAGLDELGRWRPAAQHLHHYPEGELARLIFHELAHQVVYAKDDTMFNESFATAVERLGGARWLATHASARPRAPSTRPLTRGACQFRRLALDHAAALAGVCRKSGPARQCCASRYEKDRCCRTFAPLCPAEGQLGRLCRLRPLGGPGQQRQRLARRRPTTNWCPALRRCLREGRDWTRFYDAVPDWPPCPAAERRRALQAAP